MNSHVANTAEPIPALSITLFGPMQVLVRGEPLPPPRSRKSLWLLALLTLRHDRPVDRAWLAGTLWPDSEQSLGFLRLRVVLSELRHALGNARVHLQAPNRRTLFLAGTGSKTADVYADVLVFDAAMRSGTLPALERGIALYRGPLLEGCPEEWVGQERIDREQVCLQALQTLAIAAQSAGNHEAAASYWQRGVSIEPLWDRAQRGWMEALAETGDNNAALQVYRDFSLRLKSDPQAIPDEKTTALYQRLRNEARRRADSPLSTATLATLPRTVTGYLPHALTDLVGREDERLEVATQLRRSRLVTLTGVGGIGKTRLALDVATAVVNDYADGVWLVALDSVTDGELVPGQIAGVLGVKEAPGRTLSQSVTDHLRKKRLLLVLDNCEHLLEATARFVEHLLRECIGVRILGTSRESLGITGETVWTVPALAVPELDHLPTGRVTMLRVLMSYESVQLFVARAKSVQHGFGLTSNNMYFVAQVCVQLEGVPLAIELAAARSRAMTPEQIAERLHEHLGSLGLLTGGSRTASSRQRTLRGTLDWSCALLSESEKTVLRRLSVFIGGWSLAAAEQVCAGLNIESSTVLDLLTSLVDKSLVVFTARQESTGGRYRLLEIVRQYAAEQLHDRGETQSLRTRHRDWCIAFAETAMDKDQFERSLSSLENEHDNLRAALTWCASDPDGIQKGLQLASLLWRFWSVRGYLNEGGRHLRQSVERDGAQIRTLVRAKALIGAGLLCGNYRAERVFIEESLSIY